MIDFWQQPSIGAAMRETTRTVRPPAVAGTFYPDDPDELAAVVDGYLARAMIEPRTAGPLPRAIIAPHAGYIYSGPVAASAYAHLAAARHQITRVILIGPAHYVPVRGLAVSSAAAFATPLGEVPVDLATVGRLRALPQILLFDGAHRREHCLEVQLPFLQRLLQRFAIVPLLAGDASYEEVREVIDLLWDGPETLILISSDLSHYHDCATARRLDAATAKAIEALEPEDVGEERACGRIPIGGLLKVARAKGLDVVTADLRNSADTSGVGGEVVGYGSFLFL
jgi:AmmeMemoRadiSam system protein B